MNPQSSTSHAAASTAMFLSRVLVLGLVMATAACLYPTLPNQSAQRAAAACLHVEPYVKVVNRDTEGTSRQAAASLATTHLYALERDEFQLDDFHGRGGAIASMCDDLLVVSPWGGISVIDRHGRVEYLEGKVPMNFEGLQSHPRFGRTPYYHADYFRVADILVRPHSEDRWELFVTHHYFAGECILFRLSSTTMFRGPRNFSTSQSWKTVWDAEPCRPTAAWAGHQAGGKMLAAGPDDLLIAVGDHDWVVDGVAVSQRLDSHLGKLVRVNVESGEAEIVATGLRNPQGLALDMDGNLWATDHGPLGGDELNLLEPGGNYGWNHATYGVGYGGRINVQDKRKLGRHDGFERPAFAWVHSIAATSVTVNDERRFPLWRDDLLLGSLYGAIFRVRRDGTDIQYVERIPVDVRVRDVAQLSDGRMALLSDGGGIHFLSRSYRYCDEQSINEGNIYSADCEELADSGGRFGVRLGLDGGLTIGHDADNERPEVKENQLSGAQLYAAHCRMCHSLDSEERSVGPHLADLIGRRIGQLGGWIFSPALRNLDGEWTQESLAQFLAAPQEFAPATTMGSQGLSTAEAHAIADYLAASPTLKMALSATSLSLSEHPDANDRVYTVALGEAPAAEATVTIVGATASVAVDADGATPGDQHTLTFTAQNWNTPRAVTVTALPDDDATAEHVTLTHSVQGFGNAGEVSVTAADDDRGVVLVDTMPDAPRRDPGPLALHEARGHPANAVRYAVSLSAQPTANVVLAVTTDASLVSVAPASLTFTTQNWATGQTLTASAVEDADSIGESAVLSHIANGGGYNNVNGLLRVGLVDDDGVAIDYDADNDGLIEISTLAQLDAMRWDLRGAGAPSSGNEASYEAAFPRHPAGMGCPVDSGAAVCSGYELAADLDFDTDGDGATWSGSRPASDSGDAYHNDGSGWDPIGEGGEPFRAIFNGNGHVIHNLFVNTSGRFAGLFGVFAGTSISRLGVANARVVSTDDRVGVLAGRTAAGARVAAVWTTGAVEGGARVGGLLGLASDTTVVASYSTAAVTVTAANGQGAGLVGLNRSSIEASYATGTVTGPSGATLHGVANGRGAVTSSYWNSATIADDADSTSPEGRSAAQLQAPTSATGIYADWSDLDLDGDGEASASPWDFGTATDYPALAVGANHADGLAVQRDD